MTEKAVIIHKSYIENWAEQEDPFLPKELIKRALDRIAEIEIIYPPEDIVRVEESPNTGFISLPERVGLENSVRLAGARAAYCLKLARQVLEQAGIKVTLDNFGSLP